jgi:hypothetical protein
VERLGRGVDGVKDYTLKQSAVIIAISGALLCAGFYLFAPFFAGGGRSPDRVTRLEEAELAKSIDHYAAAFEQYPAGENAAVMKALAGDNPQQVQFLNLGANSTNQYGQFVDLWNTPYKISFNSTNSFTITSAGENRMFGDKDDIVFDSSSNNPAKP